MRTGGARPILAAGLACLKVFAVPGPVAYAGDYHNSAGSRAGNVAMWRSCNLAVPSPLFVACLPPSRCLHSLTQMRILGLGHFRNPLGSASAKRREANPGVLHRRSVIRCLNRIMLEPSEVTIGEDGACTATLKSNDVRVTHIRKVLKAKDGDTVRVGVVDAGMVALMLAVPRPLQLERILPMVSSLGVRTLILTNASKVEKMYFGSHLLRDPGSLRAKMVEGLSQCGDTALPNVVVARRLTVFLQDDLERLFPRERWARVVAHPTRDLLAEGGAEGRGGGGGVCGGSFAAGKGRFADVVMPEGCNPAEAGVLVTVGPEGGWDELYELDLLRAHGFQGVTLGPRVLRSDVAVCALLALAHSWVESCERVGDSGKAEAAAKTEKGTRSPEEGSQGWPLAGAAAGG